MVILHNIRSLHNVGSMFRTADAAGIEKLYLTGITAAPVDRFGKVRPQIAKVALGAERSIPWEKAASARTLIDNLRRDGYRVYAIEQSPAAVPYIRVRMPRAANVALLVGNEVKGLPQPLLLKCDRILEIPMAGKKESLNVAVAFGIVVFHCLYAERQARA